MTTIKYQMIYWKIEKTGSNSFRVSARLFPEHPWTDCGQHYNKCDKHLLDCLIEVYGRRIYKYL